MTQRVYNFCPGPCTLPLDVLEEAQRELVDYAGSGMSLLEMSHRSPPYEAVHEEAMERARRVFRVPDAFSTLFIQGGASLQFSMIPLNLLTGSDRRAGYVVSGSWAKRAFGDAAHHGAVYAAWDGEGEGYTRMPVSGELSIEPGTTYLHITSNETIGGVRFGTWPEVEPQLIADMSSEFMSRPIPWDRFDVVYGGVQKNLAPAGMAVVFVRDSVLEASNRDLGAYLRYDVHAEKDSLYNTPPMFTIWMMSKVLRWVEEAGGLDAMERNAEARAAIVYDAIESSDGFYRSPVEVASRSVTNVVFRLPDADLEARFLAEAAGRGLVNLKGHRSVGGCRASLYNAMPIAGAQALAELMAGFRA
jgi:phosphoserine aminotransferase